MTDPPQYPEYPYSLPYPHPMPYYQLPRRPGLTTAAVVLMWILFGLGLLGGLMLGIALTVGRDQVVAVAPELAYWIPLLLAAWAAQTVVFAVLRARFALRIMRRSASARRGALALESVSIGFEVVTQALLFSAMLPPQEGMTVTFRFDCTGIVLSILVLCFLGSARSAWWCDR